MLRKPFHGWRIKQEIQKLTAIRMPSPNLNPELCREEERTLCITHVEQKVVESHACPLGTLESLKRNPKVVNKLEVYVGDEYGVAKEELKRYGGKVVPLLEQVSNKLEVYLGRGLRVAYEEAMEYGVGVMMHHFPLQVALCDKMPLSSRIGLIRASLMFEGFNLVAGPWKERAVPSRCSRLWRICLLLEWIQSGIYFGRKK